MIQLSDRLTSSTSEHAQWICEQRGHASKDGSHARSSSPGSPALKQIQVLLLLSGPPVRARLMGALDGGTMPQGEHTVTGCQVPYNEPSHRRMATILR